MSEQTYGHYGMVLVSAVAFPIASFLGLPGTDLKQTKNLAAFLIIYILSTIVLPTWLTFFGGGGSLYANREKALPKIIIIQAGHMDERMSNFLYDNSCTEVWTNDEKEVFIYESPLNAD